jgi:hypothetical protein
METIKRTPLESKYGNHHIHARMQTDGSFEATMSLLGKWLNNASTEARTLVLNRCIENFQKCPPVKKQTK